MTDKQIMIDGVNVSGCEFYWREKELCNNGNLTSYCQENKDCLYKKYKRKEQECEELKKQLERKEENYQKLLSKSNKYIHNLVDENVQDISNLARQLDQLKKELEKEKALKETYLTCYKAKHEDINGELFKLKQTLTEIREVAKQMNNECFYDDFECKDCDMKNGCTYFNKSKILQIIKEMK